MPSKVQLRRLLQMGCIMSPKVQPCSLIRGRSPHIRHLFAASFRFLSASHTTRLPLEYHSVTIRLPLSTSRQGDRVIKTEKGAFQVTLRATSNSFYVHCPEWYSGTLCRRISPAAALPLPRRLSSARGYLRESPAVVRRVSAVGRLTVYMPTLPITSRLRRS